MWSAARSPDSSVGARVCTASWVAPRRWFIPTLEGTLRAFKALAQTNKVFQPGAFPYPTITPENTPLLKMGGINQNNGPRNGFWIPRHLSPDKLAAAIDFLQFLTAPKNVALAYGIVVNTEQTVAGKKLMTKVPAIRSSTLSSSRPPAWCRPSCQR